MIRERRFSARKLLKNKVARANKFEKYSLILLSKGSGESLLKGIKRRALLAVARVVFGFSLICRFLLARDTGAFLNLASIFFKPAKNEAERILLVFLSKLVKLSMEAWVS